MIATVLSLLAGIGVPATIIGIIGKLAPWLLGPLMGGAIGKIVGPIVALCEGLVDLILVVLRWIVTKLLQGLDHIVKSVPATLTVLAMMYGSYVYGVGIDGIWQPKSSVERVEPAPPLPTPRDTPPSPRRTQSPGDWIRDVLTGGM